MASTKAGQLKSQRNFTFLLIRHSLTGAKGESLGYIDTQNTEFGQAGQNCRRGQAQSGAARAGLQGAGAQTLSLGMRALRAGV